MIRQAELVRSSEHSGQGRPYVHVGAKGMTMVKYCPGGDGPFEDWVERCPDCGRKLQEDPPAEPQADRPAPRLDGKVVYLTTVDNEPLAQLAADILRQEGIESMLRASGAGVGAWASAATFSHDLYVVDSERDRALEILKSFNNADEEPVGDDQPGTLG